MIDISKAEIYMKEKNMSIRSLANEMKISKTYLADVLKGSRDPGIKFLQGLINLGYAPQDIISMNKKDKKRIEDDRSLIKAILDNMITYSRTYDKEYSLYQVYNIRNAISDERKDRKLKNIRVNGNTKEGKHTIDERIVNIANEKYNLNISERDVKLYKKCEALEIRERKVLAQPASRASKNN